MRRLGAVLAAIVCALVACTGTSSNGSTPPPCPAGGALPEPPAVIYPKDGSTGIPDGSFALVLQHPYGTIFLTQAASIAISSPPPTAVPSPIPSPTGTPNASAVALVAYAIPALQSATTYTVNAQLGNPPCTNTMTLSTFTTQ